MNDIKKIEIRILDQRLRSWGFPKRGSEWAAGIDLHACISEPMVVPAQAPAVLVSTGMAFRIGNPDWCGLIFPRSGTAHRQGLVLGNTIGLVDPDFDGPCMISIWNRNSPLDEPPSSITINPGDRIAQLVI